jgi:uncharacterized protein
MATWFLDTGFVIALISPRDRLHTAALRLSKDIETNAMRLVTSEAIVLEIGAALSKLSFRSAAMQIIERMRADANIEVVPLTDGLLQRAFQLFKSRTDKEWSLADCASFEIMQEHRLSDALIPDMYFSQAGFRALLMEP